MDILVSSIEVGGEKRIALKFPYDQKLIALSKTVPGYRYSGSRKLFHFPYDKSVFESLKKTFSGVAVMKQEAMAEKIIPDVKQEAVIDKAAPTPQHDLPEDKIKKFRYWMQSRRYSGNTINTYSDALRSFLKFFRHKALHEICNDDVILYNNEFIRKRGLSASYQNQVVNAIKLFFITVENRSLVIEQVHRPKKAKPLPNVLGKEEVKMILSAHVNLKHRAMLSLIYSCGLRCGELLALKPERVDRNRGLLIIKQAKGRKDRVVPLSQKILGMLDECVSVCKPQVYLFEGWKAGRPYDERSLQHVLKQALAKAGISKPVTLHWLRHSYATHLLENGTDLRYIQELLGHSRSTTTEIYTHVSRKSIQNIISPFDQL